MDNEKEIPGESVPALEDAQMDLITAIRMEEFVNDAVRTEPNYPDYQRALKRIGDANNIRLLHAAMGLVTEAGEFMDALKKHIFYGKPLDTVNLIEELGDSSWYERIALEALHTRYFDMLQRNVDKLKSRFPDKFKESSAINRDLDKEREILEATSPHNTDKGQL